MQPCRSTPFCTMRVRVAFPIVDVLWSLLKTEAQRGRWRVKKSECVILLRTLKAPPRMREKCEKVETSEVWWSKDKAGIVAIVQYNMYVWCAVHAKILELKNPLRGRGNLLAAGHKCGNQAAGVNGVLYFGRRNGENWWTCGENVASLSENALVRSWVHFVKIIGFQLTKNVCKIESEHGFK